MEANPAGNRGRNSMAAWAAGAVGAGVLALMLSAAALPGAKQASGPSSSPSAQSEPSAPSETSDSRCVVRLHGKSGAGGDSYVEDDVTIVLPNGNAEGWGGRQWLYFPDERFEEARQIVADAVADCDSILLDGFSNGAAFAAKLYCRGETFGGRLIGVVIDDPVPDEGVTDCDPDPGVRVTLYWTGALAETARPGWDCSLADWTCEGGVTIGIDAYAEWLGTEIVASPHDAHEWFWDAPELDDWTPVELAGPLIDSTATPGTEA